MRYRLSTLQNQQLANLYLMTPQLCRREELLSSCVGSPSLRYVRLDGVGCPGLVQRHAACGILVPSSLHRSTWVEVGLDLNGVDHDRNSSRARWVDRYGQRTGQQPSSAVVNGFGLQLVRSDVGQTVMRVVPFQYICR